MSKENDNTNIKTIYIGIDIHTENLNITFYDPETRIHNYERRMKAVDAYLVGYIKKIIGKHYSDSEYNFIIGYEAGYTGYSTQRYLKDKGFNCIILAPNSITRSPKEKRMKNDVLDARLIAETLASKKYSSVFIPTRKDESVRQLISYRKGIVEEITRIKNQLQALLVQTGFEDYSSNSNWTEAHLKDIADFIDEEIELPKTKFVLTGYLDDLKHQKVRLQAVDELIEETAQEDEYAPMVRILCSFKGISTLIALSLIICIGDIRRFDSAQCLAKYFGLTPGEHISDGKGHRP